MDTERQPVAAREEIDVRGVLLVAGGLVAITGIALVATWLQMTGLWRARLRALPPPSPVATALPDAPPEPRLEIAPERELRALRGEEEQQLHAYGWVDRGAGVVRIPIERAMELVANEGAR